MGVKHWHGAADDSWFIHLAVEVPGKNCSNEWLEKVSDEEYHQVVCVSGTDHGIVSCD